MDAVIHATGPGKGSARPEEGVVERDGWPARSQVISRESSFVNQINQHGEDMKSYSVFLIVIAFLLGGCSKSDGPNSPSGQGQIRMSLIDAPAGYDAVNIVVTEVSVHKADADAGSGWVVLSSLTQTHNLLSLRNGVSAILAEKELDAGMYTQIRLKLGTGCNIVIGGVQTNLDVSANSDFMIVHPFTVTTNGTTGLTIDFDVARSIRVTDLAQFKLMPVCRAVDDDKAGSISGLVSPAPALSTIFTVAGSDTISVAADSASGNFKLMAVPAGTYAIRITPTQGAYRDTTISNVSVEAGRNTAVGTIELQQKSGFAQ